MTHNRAPISAGFPCEVVITSLFVAANPAFLSKVALQQQVSTLFVKASPSFAWTLPRATVAIRSPIFTWSWSDWPCCGIQKMTGLRVHLPNSSVPVTTPWQPTSLWSQLAGA
jgi:hypothetical protein